MGEECKQKYLHEHFLQDDFHGFLNDAQTTLNKTQASDPIKREYFWMKIWIHLSNSFGFTLVFILTFTHAKIVYTIFFVKLKSC